MWVQLPCHVHLLQMLEYPVLVEKQTVRFDVELLLIQCLFGFLEQGAGVQAFALHDYVRLC